MLNVDFEYRAARAGRRDRPVPVGSSTQVKNAAQQYGETIHASKIAFFIHDRA